MTRPRRRSALTQINSATIFSGQRAKANHTLTIKGAKRDEKEETKKDYNYMRERSFGSFQRILTVPEGIDADKAEATFNKGVLTVTLPKTVEAQKAEKRITVKAA
ncbi:MAG: Hsp20/alpha crystallin family protein [Hyphomicrobiales bacterium]|nr:Hsp20/alpha crystallin family protein [Hyphomicrobiales bacterium]